jgi:iron complex outermembrane receptor protein
MRPKEVKKRTVGYRRERAAEHGLVTATQLEADRLRLQSKKTAVDGYALWTFNPEVKLRLSVSNALAQDYVSTTVVDGAGLRETNASNARSFVNTQVRLEMKL